MKASLFPFRTARPTRLTRLTPLIPVARLAGLGRLGLLASLGIALACSPPAPTEHAGHGVAVDVDPTARTITLEHGDIPDLMKAMTMTFPVAPEVDLGAVAKGDAVDFEVRSEGSTITVIAIEPAPSDAEETEQAAQAEEADAAP